jgi:hypothetical protein
MEQLKKTFMDQGEEGEQLFQKTVESIRYSLETGISKIFLLGAIMSLLAFLLICTIPGRHKTSDE